MNGQDTPQRVEQTSPETQAAKRLDGLWWAGALIWAGLVLVVDNLGQLPQVGQADAWSWIFLGAGLMALVMNACRVLGTPQRPEDRVVGLNLPRPRTWDWIWTGALILLGLGGIANIAFTWPAILILAGVLLLVRSLTGRA